MFLRLILGMILATSAGWGADVPAVVREALEQPDRVIVYALAPERLKSGEGMHGFRVLSEHPVEAKDSIREIGEDMVKSIASGDTSAFCFEPRHAVRVIHGKRLYDFVICYHCESYQLWVGGKSKMSGPYGGSPTVLDRFLGSAQRK